MNEGTTGGPSSEEIAAQVSLSSDGASHGEPTVSAISVETVPNKGCCDGAAVLSIDELLGHALSASPSSAPSLSERLGVVMGGRDASDSCRLSAPLVGLNKSPSHPVYKISFRAVEATKVAKKCRLESVWPVCPCPVGSKVARPASPPLPPVPPGAAAATPRARLYGSVNLSHRLSYLGQLPLDSQGRRHRIPAPAPILRGGKERWPSLQRAFQKHCSEDPAQPR